MMKKPRTRLRPIDIIGQLDIYATQVLDDQDRVLFDEAVRASKAGAMRGAYVLIWLSCAESLKRRFNAVRLRDANANRVAGEIARKEAAHQSIDSYLLGEAKTYGFIDDAGFTRLHHIYEMRCVYGHPYERQPKAEDTIAAASAVIDLVLSQPVRLRHGYLTEQVRLLTQERTFLDDQRASVAEYAKEVFARMDGSLTEWFVRSLWTTTELLVKDKSMAIFVRRTWWFCAELLALSPARLLRDLDFATALTGAPVLGSASLADPRVFTGVTRHVQDMIVGNIVEDAKLTAGSLRKLDALAATGALNARHISRFQSAVDSLSFKVLADAGIGLHYYASRIIADLKSYSWYTQNPAIEVLKNGGRESIAALDDAAQQRLGNNVLQSADGGASSARKFLDEIAEDPLPWPVPFVAGLVAECFVNDENQIRFKTKRANDALLSVRALAAAGKRKVIEDVVARIAQGKPKSGYCDNESQKEAIALIDDLVVAEPEKLKTLAMLRKAVEAVELPEEDT
jgi:hypothetical protein